MTRIRHRYNDGHHRRAILPGWSQWRTMPDDRAALVAMSYLSMRATVEVERVEAQVALFTVAR